ncbi:MAG: thermonuclease family protein [Candidatus Doudnabacteria bacterium]|nr:thermonuclease family protein [Candidatus Doudnabacteria bacterium]
MNSKMKNLWWLLAALFIFTVGNYYQKTQPSIPHLSQFNFDKTIKTIPGEWIQVAQVIDGDTVVLINGDHVRYIGIDTPEEFDQRKPVQCFAKEAAEKNRQLVEGKKIKFEKDVNTYDKYGRWLGYVYLEDGTFVNEKLVRDGFAFSYVYPPDIFKSEIFIAAETYARENKLGLWSGQCSITKLKGGREQTNPVD